MNEFVDKFGAVWIISQKLSELQEDINYAFKFEDGNSKHWKQSLSWVLSHIEDCVKDAKRLTNGFLHELRKEVKVHEAQLG